MLSSVFKAVDLGGSQSPPPPVEDSELEKEMKEIEDLTEYLYSSARPPTFTDFYEVVKNDIYNEKNGHHQKYPGLPENQSQLETVVPSPIKESAERLEEKICQKCTKCSSILCENECPKCPKVNQTNQAKNDLVTTTPRDTVGWEEKAKEGPNSKITRPHLNYVTKQRQGLFKPPEALSFQAYCELAKREEEESNRLKEAFKPIQLTFTTTDDPKASKDNDLPTFANHNATDQVPRTSVHSPVPENLFVETRPLDDKDTFQEYFGTLSKQINNNKGIDVPKNPPAGIPMKIKVVTVLEPACIFVQSAEEMQTVDSIKLELSNTSLRKLRVEDIAEGTYVALVHENEYYRGQVQAKDERAEIFKIRLIDCAVVVVKPIYDMYELPTGMKDLNRQILSLTIQGIESTKQAGWKEAIHSYLTENLVGKTVILRITHAMSCLDCHYYGSLHLDGEEISVSEDLIQRGLALPANEDDLQINIVNPKYKDYTPPILEKGEVVSVCITKVESVAEFYVRIDPANFHELEKEIYWIGKEVTPKVYSETYYDGTRMCVTLNPKSKQKEMIRAFCKGIDFTGTPNKAVIFNIDSGMTHEVSLNLLNGYDAKFERAFEPRAYRVGIAAKPVSNEWPSETTISLKDIMESNQKGKRYVDLTCVGQNANGSLVQLKMEGGSTTFEQALADVGEATLEVEDGDIHTSACLSDEYKAFISDSGNLSECSKANSSPYSFKNIPVADVPAEGDSLETRRFKGLHLYLIMTEKSYDLHQMLKEECRILVHDKKLEPGEYMFQIGDVVLAPMLNKNYMRGCITGISTGIDGAKVAELNSFDIGKTTTQRIKVSNLKLPSELAMKTPQLGHVVWLEGVDENTLVSSKDIEVFIDPFIKQKTTLRKIKKLTTNRWVVRLEMQNPNGESLLLSKHIEKFSRWNWEKYFNAGFIVQKRLFKKLYATSNFSWNLSTFLAMPVGKHKVTIRHVWFPNPSYPSLICMNVIPINDGPINDDFNILQHQLAKFFEKIPKNNEMPLQNSPTFEEIVVIRVTEKQELSCPSGCHRCTRSNDGEEGFNCVDCFQLIMQEPTMNSKQVCKSAGLDIREVPPEMLRVPSIGKFLFVDSLPNNDPAMRKYLEKFCTVGREIDIEVSAESVQELQEFSRMRLSVHVPEILQNYMKLQRNQRD